MARRRVTHAWPGLLMLLGSLGVWAGDVPAQPTQEGLPLGVPRKTLDNAKLLAGRLANVQRMVDQQQWPEAIDEYQHLLDKSGDDLVLVSPRQLVQARRLCHIHLAALPEAGLRMYRSRVEEQARKWLEQGAAQRDTRLLRRLVDEAFASRSTERALDLLGDLAFERGDFDEAEVWWRMLARPASEAGRKQRADELVFPDPQGDPAPVRAKQILAQLFRGERHGLTEALKVFAEKHGKDEGNLAGRKGVYSATLQALIDQAGGLTAPPGVADWATFAGATRRSLVPVPAPRYLQYEGPQWRFRLDGRPPRVEGEGAAAVLTSARAAQALVVHPVVVGEHVLIADATRVVAVDVEKGNHSEWYALPVNKVEVEAKQPARQEVRYTLTVADGRVYARLGRASPSPREGISDSFVVCLNLLPGRNGSHERWVVKPNEPGSVFEGAPVVRDERAYVAVTRYDGRQAVTAIACYDADTGAPRWRQDVCELEVLDGEPRSRHQLLTLAGPNVVYCSHAGAVVAVDAVNGRRVWAARYSSRGGRTEDGDPAPRDLAPCVAADGRLYVAPADLDRILCLDASTGRMIWESRGVEVVHLLGVARGRLIFTTGSRPRGIRALEAATGDDLREWLQPGDGQSELPAFGRGFLAGDLVFWPTVDGLRVLDQEDGQPLPEVDLTRLRHIRCGNMAYGNGCLAVADGAELLIYVPPGRRHGQRKQEATAAPRQAAAQFRLARAEADAGYGEAALGHFAMAEKLAGREERGLHGFLRVEARDCRHELLLELAAQAQASKHWDEAAALLGRAAAEEFAVPARLRALRRSAEAWLAAGQPAHAVALAQTILADATLRKGHMDDPNGSVQLAAAWATSKTKQWLAATGGTLQVAYEQQARKLLHPAPGESEQSSLERLLREYPAAAVSTTASLRLAHLHEQAHRFGAAAAAYRLLLRKPVNDLERSQARVGLARAYERQGCWDAARQTWHALVQDAGDQFLVHLDPSRKARDVVTERLRKPEYRPRLAPGRPGLSPPLFQAWQTSHVDEPPGAPAHSLARLLLPEADGATGVEPGHFFFARGPFLVCQDASTGKARWSRKLIEPPGWIGRFADVVLAAGEQSIQGLRLADGEELWEFLGASTDPPLGALSAFHLATGRLFFLQGERRLFALDASSGDVLWNQWAPAARVQPVDLGGRFYPLYHAGRETVVVQTTGGQRLVLEAGTGRRLQDAVTSKPAWPRSPLPLDERRICLIPDARHFAMLDASSGKEAWCHTIERGASLTGEPPQVLAQGGALLLLVARNQGYELQRLDVATGARRWSEAVWLGRERIDLEHGALDDRAVYFVHDGRLQARAMVDGKRIWQTPLVGPPGPWQVVRTRDTLIVYPLRTRGSLEVEDHRRRFVAQWLWRGWRQPFPWPSVSEWKRFAVCLQDACTRHSYPVVLCDPLDGRTLQCLHLTPAGARADVAVLHRMLAVASGNRAWGLTMAGKE